MQTVWMSYLVLYLQGVVGLTLPGGQPVPGSRTAGRHAGPRVLRPALRSRVRGTAADAARARRHRLDPLHLAHPGHGCRCLDDGLAALTAFFGSVGIGWNGVQHTWLAELAGPRAAGAAVGLGLALSSAGGTVGPLLFGHVLQATGGYRWPWLGLAGAMVVALGLLALVRERRRAAEALVAAGG